MWGVYAWAVGHAGLPRAPANATSHTTRGGVSSRSVLVRAQAHTLVLQISVCAQDMENATRWLVLATVRVGIQVSIVPKRNALLTAVLAIPESQRGCVIHGGESVPATQIGKEVDVNFEDVPMIVMATVIATKPQGPVLVTMDIALLTAKKSLLVGLSLRIGGNLSMRKDGLRAPTRCSSLDYIGIPRAVKACTALKWHSVLHRVQEIKRWV